MAAIPPWAGYNPFRFLVERLYNGATESIGVAKVLQSETNAMEILDAMDI